MIPAALANAFYSPRTNYGSVRTIEEYRADSNVVAVDFTRARMPRQTVEPTQPSCSLEWKSIATQRLSSLHRLKDGWDGVGSRSVADVALTKADRILELAFKGVGAPAPPVAVPCADGALQLEWWLVDSRFEMSIEPDGSLESWALDRPSGHEVFAEGPDAIGLLAKWSARLTADKLVQPA